MKLFLHIGTEKTGSSFLQTTAARNRPVLEKAGIYFPLAGKREHDMISGKVSPGNAKPLFVALKACKAELVQQLLKKASEEARIKKCNRILFSNENLIDLFQYDQSLTILKDVCNSLGIEQISVFLMVRNPVDQALSLYKHRAKSGAVREIEYWIRHEYTTMKVLDDFVHRAPSVEMEFILRKYTQSSQAMSQSFFKEWLEVAETISFADELVNPSLTLSELLFLKSQYDIDSSLVEYYYEAFLHLPKRVKARDELLEAAYRKRIAEALQLYENTVQQVNKWLPENEKLEWQTSNKEGNIQNGDNLTLQLSEQQVRALLLKNNEVFSFAGKFRFWVRQIKLKIIALVKP